MDFPPKEELELVAEQQLGRVEEEVEARHCLLVTQA
jgi:hypothetical protein